MNIASLISSLTEPMMVVMVLALLGGWHAGLRGSTYVWYALYLMFLSSIIWIARLRFMKSLHTNWDVSSRPKRVRLLLLLLGFSALFFASLFLFQNFELMRLSVRLFLWLVGFFLITLKTRISGHMAVLTLVVSYWWPLVVFLPFVGWSRIVLKRHTFIEVIGGFLYSSLFLVWLS